MQLKFLWSAMLLLVSVATSSQAAAPQDALKLHQRALAATCANCHGTEGRTTDGSAIPSLAGMPREYMVAQMKAFRDGTRPATVMHQLAKGLTEEQIQSVATYFSTIKR
ncbi:MAG: cytochrome c [Candidatus Aquirickettsiella gammari]